MVVEVVLAGDWLVAPPCRDPEQGSPTRRPSRRCEYATGPVGLAENVLEIDVLYAQSRCARRASPASTMGERLTGAGGVETVLRSRAATSTKAARRQGNLKTRDERLGESRSSASLLGQLHGDVGEPVAVVAVAGRSRRGARGSAAGGVGSLGGGASFQDGADGCGKLFWRSRMSAYRCRPRPDLECR